jgi:hypothetical protein
MYVPDLVDLFEQHGFKAHLFSAFEEPRFSRIMGPYSIFQRMPQVSDLRNEKRLVHFPLKKRTMLREYSESVHQLRRIYANIYRLKIYRVIVAVAVAVTVALLHFLRLTGQFT